MLAFARLGYGTAVNIESYYYDGVRRIQEVVQEPIPSTVPKEANSTSSPTYVFRVDREYVHGLSSGAYVDEYIAEIDCRDTSNGGTAPPNSGGTAYFVLQDGNYNVVALVNGLGEVQAQHSYDPYGELITSEIRASSGPFAGGLLPLISTGLGGGNSTSTVNSRLGHQGLHASRLGVFGQQTTLGSGSGRTIIPGAGLNLTFQTDHRVYLPSLGRWMQADPNGCGQPIALSTSRVG